MSRNPGRGVPPVAPGVVQRVRLGERDDECRAPPRRKLGRARRKGSRLVVKNRRKLVLGVAVGAVAVGLVALAASAGKLDCVPVFGGSGETPETVTAPTARELAREFAPVIRLAAQDPFAPIDRAEDLSVADLDTSSGGPVTVTRRPSLSQLPVTPPCPKRCRLYLDLEERGGPGGHTKLGSYTTLESTAEPPGVPPTVYYHVLHYTPSGDYTVQYWFLYLFNSFPFDHHESDWDDVIVRVSDARAPEEVFFSTHARGRTASWKDVESTGDHVVDYSAFGSHANYANT